ncbi:MAG: 5-formyltetrahydrofolate cyclo-ligase [Erysipelotrichaceae bacterium]|nr:5-formyltetrahydrofolate cyclo-ligase [Erysipelotrichaceae bacterium]MBR2702370.1 5-formyltetrahydrofolate cyclo-ligase [Erysipelotrichaceae bacterium]
MNKRELRQLIRNKQLSGKYIHDASERIQKKVIDSEEFISSKKIFCYISVAGEVSTDRIISKALKTKEVYVPKCIAKGVMKAVRIDNVDGLVKNRYGIPEPDNTDITADEFDLIIVPCLCAGKNGERLGHGAGYYDRFLKDSKGRTVCLCFEGRIRDDIIMDDNDIYMDQVVTEKNAY